jgi:hypothetical protein
MVRTLVILAFVLGACDVGSVLNRQNPQVDAPGGHQDGNGGGPDGPGNGCVAAVTPVGAHLHTAGGTSNAGQNCITGGCHLVNQTGAGAPTFRAAGSLYTSAAGTAPKTGATIKIASGANTLTAKTDDAGNFYICQAGDNCANVQPALTFPANALATSCPSLNNMSGQLVTGGGACNNCHNKLANAMAPPVNIP